MRPAAVGRRREGGGGSAHGRPERPSAATRPAPSPPGKGANHWPAPSRWTATAPDPARLRPTVRPYHRMPPRPRSLAPTGCASVSLLSCLLSPLLLTIALPLAGHHLPPPQAADVDVGLGAYGIGGWEGEGQGKRERRPSSKGKKKGTRAGASGSGPSAPLFSIASPLHAHGDTIDALLVA